MNTSIATTQPQQPVITEKQAIKLLQGYALERRNALLSYPNAKGVSEKLIAIDEILYMLSSADNLMPRAACMLILKTWFNFRYISPTATRKLFLTWQYKIEDIMSACREYLGYRAQ